MEALLQKSAFVESKTAQRKVTRSAATPNLAGIQAAAVRLPLCFVLAGVVSLLISAGFLLAQPDLLAMYHYTPHLIAMTHLFVLGFICSIVMGAMYQLVPVTLETQLFSERLVKWQFAAHLIGFTGMVWAFWNFNMVLVGAFGSLLTLGVGLFVFNMACTLAKVKNWKVSNSASPRRCFGCRPRLRRDWF
jgi:cbb3-type cytochrome oxidase subunit 1